MTTFQIHHNKLWLTPAEASRYTGHECHSFRHWAMNGIIKCKANPMKKGLNAWLYNRQDIDQNILRIKETN